MQNIRTNALAIIKKRGKLLALKGEDAAKNEIFLRLLGGGIEFGETSLVALHREFKEELGASLKDVRLLSVIENVFEFNGVPSHEITFLYSAEIVEDSINDVEKIKILDSKKEKYAEWFEIEKIKKENIAVYPKEAKEYLN